jgi:hypothetical protein
MLKCSSNVTRISLIRYPAPRVCRKVDLEGWGRGGCSLPWDVPLWYMGVVVAMGRDVGGRRSTTYISQPFGIGY